MMLLTMTDIEIYRINTIKNVIDKRISGVDAAALLNLSPRQVYLLTKQYLKHGAEGLISHTDLNIIKAVSNSHKGQQGSDFLF